jgi:hypothetical protein
MTEIRIFGNKKSFIETNEKEYVEINLKGDFDFNAASGVNISYEGHVLAFNNRHSLFQLSEKAIGATPDKFTSLLQEINLDSSFIRRFNNIGKIEFELFKSIFLLYHWIELSLAAPQDVSLKDKIFDEFIVDWTNVPEAQKEIYFIKEKYITKDNEKMIRLLMDLNLLASLSISISSGERYEAYFIPLVKPGVPRDYFLALDNRVGEKAYTLWKELLRDRNIRMSNWANNRF